MKLFLAPALAAAVVAGGVWLAPGVASAQNYDQNWNQNRGQYRQSQNTQRQNRNYNQGATAWGDPWMNENDFDYNERHWLPSNRADDDRYRYSGTDRYDNRYSNRYDDRYYDNRGHAWRDRDDWNRQGSYNDRYDQRYRNDGQLGGYYDRDENRRYDSDE